MDQNRFDSFTRLFGDRSLSRRKALATGGAVLAAGALSQVARPGLAQEATPETDGMDAGGTGVAEMLFVQSFHGGSVAKTEGQEGRYTVTLEQGSGQTIYFSDRPDRIVGSSPTEAFLDGLGFSEDNPPNAALIVETAPGETDIAVVELFNPVFTPDGVNVTYDVELLANWRESLEMAFSEAPTDLAEFTPAFGAAQLFIDSCADRGIICHKGTHAVGEFMSQGFCYWGRYAGCYPCENGGAGNRDEIASYWEQRCNDTYDECQGGCTIAYAGPLICTDPRGCN